MSLASPALQDLFDTPTSFEMVIRLVHPLVHRSGVAEFTTLTDTNGIVQQVEALGPGRVWHTIRYSMVSTPAGWRIGGYAVAPSTRGRARD